MVFALFALQVSPYYTFSLSAKHNIEPLVVINENDITKCSKYKGKCCLSKKKLALQVLFSKLLSNTELFQQ